MSLCLFSLTISILIWSFTFIVHEFYSHHIYLKKNSSIFSSAQYTNNWSFFWGWVFTLYFYFFFSLYQNDPRYNFTQFFIVSHKFICIEIFQFCFFLDKVWNWNWIEIRKTYTAQDDLLCRIDWNCIASYASCNIWSNCQTQKLLTYVHTHTHTQAKTSILTSKTDPKS